MRRGCLPRRHHNRGEAHASRRRRWDPVGGRGEGQGDRPARPGRRLRRQVQWRQQRRTYRRHRRRGVRLPPPARGRAHPRRHAHDRQWRGRGPGGALQRDRRDRGTRPGRLVLAHLRRRAPHPLLQPGAGPHHRALPRLPSARHHRPRHRTHLCGQDEPCGSARPGPLRRVDPASEGPFRARPEERPLPQGLQPTGHRPR